MNSEEGEGKEDEDDGEEDWKILMKGNKIKIKKIGDDEEGEEEEGKWRR